MRGPTRPNESQANGRNSGQCSLIDAMSPMVVPASSQTVAHATYSNVTRTAGASVEGAATRPGSRIRVRIAEGSIVIAPRSCARLALEGRPSLGIFHGDVRAHRRGDHDDRPYTKRRQGRRDFFHAVLRT